MLLQSGEFYDYEEGDSGGSLYKINRIENLYNSKKQLLDGLIYEVEVLNRERFKVYKSNVHYAIIASYCDYAAIWQTALKSGQINGEKIEERKAYIEKSGYQCVKKWLESCIGRTINIYDIINYNFTKAWDIYFECENHKWSIQIPVVSNISLRYFNDYEGCCFKIEIFNCDTDSFSKLIGSTFDENEIKGIMNKWLEKRRKINVKNK